MAQVEENTTCCAPASRAAWRTLSVHIMFVSAYGRGRSMLSGTDVSAARWNTTSASRNVRCNAFGSRIEAFTTFTRFSTPARFCRRPTERLSKTTTSFAPARRSTRWDPMNPAPPVTTTRFPRSIAPRTSAAVLKLPRPSGPHCGHGAVRGDPDHEVLRGEDVLHPGIDCLGASHGVEVSEPPGAGRFLRRVERGCVRVHPEGGVVEGRLRNGPRPLEHRAHGTVDLEKEELCAEARSPGSSRVHQGHLDSSASDVPPRPPLRRVQRRDRVRPRLRREVREFDGPQPPWGDDEGDEDREEGPPEGG